MISQYFNKHSEEIPLFRALYYVAVPITWACWKLGLHPNVVTTLSNVAAAGAVAALLFFQDANLQAWSWAILVFLSILFDLADGTVARLSGKSSPNGGLYDAFSDKIKVCVFCACIALRFPSNAMSMLAMATIACFLLIGALNEKSAAAPSAASARAEAGAFKERLKSIRWFRNVFVGTRNSLLLVQAQLLLLFIPCAFSENLAFFCMGWFGLACLRGVAQLLRSQIALNNAR